MKNVTIYTDGACRGNGKENTIGGYGIILIYNETKKEINKAFRNTTNNIMELTAVIDALSVLKEPCCAKIYSDSAYVVNAVNLNWLNNWQRNGWKSASKEPVKNKELWEQLLQLIKYHKVEFIKVKGHSTNELNNRCDQLANEAMDEIQINIT
ncbi:MAG: rnhA [Clostridiaceae bacterium]|jgi:ribonuclease HI|nr:rnhA [Clostridiaceae bacterium]